MAFAILFLLFVSQLPTIVPTNTTLIRFDHYTVNLIWPITFCYIHDNQCIDSKIKLEFLVNGLWPSFEDGSDVTVTMCNATAFPFPAKQEVASWPFTKILLQFWPNLLGDDFDFWEGQWNDHGICSTLKPKDYFKLTYDLFYLKFSMLQKNLRVKGIVPGKRPYSRNFLYQSFKKILGKHVTLSCVSKQQNYYLFEVHACLDPKQYLPIPIDCPQDIIACGEPDKDVPVFLPDSKL